MNKEIISININRKEFNHIIDVLCEETNCEDIACDECALKYNDKIVELLETGKWPIL